MEEKPMPFDWQVPLFSLPLKLQCYPPLSVSTPYLQADPQLRAKWRARLGPSPGRRVGLAWAGSRTFANDQRRSVPPEKLQPLFSIPEIQFISLRVDSKEPLPSAFAAAGVLDFTAEMGDFSRSAALVAELDLVITVDTAMAHLAGALGRPVWLLLPFVPDWRWGLESETTPWYPSMRLFRQSKANDWAEVLARVTAALQQSGVSPCQVTRVGISG
jgi:hypothetical protein